ncbi:MAG: hypothetical protein JOZ10_08745 [Acidobacteria bacterium]|nr:hypothetical protein [Acidobacteriota bacterium]
MSTSTFRFSSFCFAIALAFATMGFAQNDPEAAAAVSGAAAGYGDLAPVDATQLPGNTGATSSLVIDATTGTVVSGLGGGGFNPSFAKSRAAADVSRIDGLNTIPTFDGAFFAQAGPSSQGGKLWRYSMMGNSPLIGGTTTLPAQIDEVSLQLLNADGTVFKTVSMDSFEDLFLESPNFSNRVTYGTGAHIQYADAIHRAQFFNQMKPNWHTNFAPTVVSKTTITVPRFVNVRLSNGTIVTARSYFTGTAADGSTFVLMLSPLFNFFFGNEVVNQINNGNFTTDGVSMLLFPNTFLFNLNTANPNAPGGCCVLGFHTYFYDPPTTPQDRWVTMYASWISPGLFGGGFLDVTALSHEISESFADPFVDNATPVWQFPGVPANAKVCQNNLEEGDPIEVLSNATIPIAVKNGKQIFTYHPQNIPLVQWFEMGPSSNAIDGAFSYPDETLLPHSALPCPQ